MRGRMELRAGVSVGLSVGVSMAAWRVVWRVHGAGVRGGLWHRCAATGLIEHRRWRRRMEFGMSALGHFLRQSGTF